MLQGEKEIIHTIESVLRIAALVSGAILAVWGIVVNRVRAAVRGQRTICAAELVAESKARETGESALVARVENLDKALTSRVENLARDVHNYMGKLDLMSEHMHRVELASVEEVGALRTEMREGFARLSGLLDKGFNGPGHRRLSPHHEGDDDV